MVGGVLDATAPPGAVIDRVVLHATVLETDGDSFRLTAAMARARRGKRAKAK